MTNLADLADLTPIQVWDGVVARRVQGERLTLAVVELAPDAVVPEHRHANEQCGLVIEGEVTFRIGDEERVLGPGGTWRIVSDTPHSRGDRAGRSGRDRRVRAGPRRLGGPARGGHGRRAAQLVWPRGR